MVLRVDDTTVVRPDHLPCSGRVASDASSSGNAGALPQTGSRNDTVVEPPAPSVQGPEHPVSRAQSWLDFEFKSVRAERLVRIATNLIGAIGAAFFAQATLRVYLQSHRLIGAAFFVEQMWIVVAYLIRRPARSASRRLGDWLLAFGGTFAGVLFRPDGAHPQWGLTAGLAVQLVGLAICVTSFLALGRSFGFVAADRGLVRRRPLCHRPPSHLCLLFPAPVRLSVAEHLVAQRPRDARRFRLQCRSRRCGGPCARYEQGLRRVSASGPMEVDPRHLVGGVNVTPSGRAFARHIGEGLRRRRTRHAATLQRACPSAPPTKEGTYSPPFSEYRAPGACSKAPVGAQNLRPETRNVRKRRGAYGPSMRW